jgi:hypothetical protein
MTRIASFKPAVCGLVLPLILSACDMNAPSPLSSAYGQPADAIIWVEVPPDSVADGNVEMYY